MPEQMDRDCQLSVIKRDCTLRGAAAATFSKLVKRLEFRFKRPTLWDAFPEYPAWPRGFTVLVLLLIHSMTSRSPVSVHVPMVNARPSQSSMWGRGFVGGLSEAEPDIPISSPSLDESMPPRPFGGTDFPTAYPISYTCSRTGVEYYMRRYCLLGLACTAIKLPVL